MTGGKSSDELGLDASGGAAEGRTKTSHLSIRFRRGPTVAIILAALLWAGLIALWRSL